MFIKRSDAIESLLKLPMDGVSVYDKGYAVGVKHAIEHIDSLPSVEVIAEPPKRSDGIVSEHSNGTVSMTKQTWEDVKNTMEQYKAKIEERTISSWTHDGCEGCEYEHEYFDKEPCHSCKQNYMDKWTKKKERITFIDKRKLLDKLWAMMDDEKSEGIKDGIIQAILIATRMNTAETVERGDVPYDETAQEYTEFI